MRSTFYQVIYRKIFFLNINWKRFNIKADQILIKQKRNTWSRVKRNYELYLFLLPIILVYLLFKYYPMYGVQIAFKDFSPSQGIWGSEWVGFPVPIIIAIMLNQMLGKRYKKFIQTGSDHVLVF
ncbi:putative aldouronate transport system permease protein [Fontibacillus panacisegetis]|uniref:Putative aldouronate transport system permease protein n=1 Tax=Fontibacillus panacisegetis TaxID=670482 RepID=A0A1G7N9T4_9BACL|nr:putative aldouronate transport system permease protein [Fontibacillus panacisegetis]